MTEFYLVTETDYIVAYTGRMDERLSSGMTLGEAMKSSRDWWDKRGRQLIIAMREHQRKVQGGEFSSANPDHANHVNSGILNARPYSELNGRERIEVMAHWHNSHVRIKDMTDLKKPTYQMGKGFIEYDPND